MNTDNHNMNLSPFPTLSSAAEARVLGQLLTAQSILDVIPDAEGVSDFLCQTIGKVPGVRTTRRHLPPPAAWRGQRNDPDRIVLEMRTGTNCLGQIEIDVGDPVRLAPFLPYLRNLVNVATIHLENRAFAEQMARTNAELVLAREALEQRVQARTRQLREEIEQRKASEQAQANSQAQLRAIFDQAAAGICHTALDGYLLHPNRKFGAILGYSEAELRQLTFADFTHPDDRAASRAQLEQLRAGQLQTFSMELRVICKNGQTIWVNSSVSLARGDSGAPIGYVAVLQDITSRKKADQLRNDETRMLERMAHGAPLGETLAAVAAAVERQLEDSVAALLLLDEQENRLSGCVAPGLSVKEQQALLHAAQPLVASRSWRPAVPPHLRGQAGYGVTVQAPPLGDCTLMPIAGTSGHLLGALVVGYRRPGKVDIAEKEIAARACYLSGLAIERGQSERRLRQLAQFDPLTGLANRARFYTCLSDALAAGDRSDEEVAVLLLDLDRFKAVNDTLGHDVGDQLLQQVALRLRECAGQDDTIARLGGDEFVIIQAGAPQPQGAQRLARELVRRLGAPYQVGGQEIHSGCSVGIAVHAPRRGSAEQLLKQADMAMYRAKSTGRKNFQFYTEALNTEALRRQRLETALRQALDRNTLALHYQPQIDIATGRIRGVEALLRWNDPALSDVSTAELIQLAEDTGLILPLGDWVIREACRQNSRWQTQGLAPFTVAVNVSVRQMKDPHFPERLRATVAESGLDPSWLELEITEGILMDDTEVSTRMLRQFKEMGIRIAIDDFGTGFSSLSYLRHFPADILKIDRSFVRRLAHSREDLAVTETIIHLAHSLDMAVVAEGVETDAQAQVLGRHPALLAQGYLYCRPVPAPQLAAFVAGRGGSPMRAA